MIVVQNGLSLVEILLHAALGAPWNGQHPIQVIAHNCGFRAHRAHVFELFKLRIGLFTRFFAELGLIDFLLKLGNFAFTFFAVTQLLLNGLHLLIQIVFALRALHLGFDAGFDLFLDLQHRHLALHQAIDLLQTLTDRQRLQKLLLLCHFDAQMARYQIRQFRRIITFRNGRKCFFWNVFLHLGVTGKFICHGAQ